MNTSRLRSLLQATLLAIPSTTAALVAQTPGTLDPSFGVLGQATYPGATAYPYAVAVQADHKVIAVGYESVGGTSKWLVTRFLADGTLDFSFGNGGRVHPVSGTAAHVAIDGQGRIVVAGSARLSPSLVEFGVARLDPVTGALDPTFGSTGLVITHMSNQSDQSSEARALAIQSDGRIVVGGLARRKKNNTVSSDFALARYHANGGLDTSFGTGGKVIDDYTSGFDNVFFRCLTLQPDGKIVTGGSNQLAWYDGWTLARYRANGSVDNSFGTKGKFVGTFPGFVNVRLAELILLPDGKILAGGRCFTNPGGVDMLLARHNSNGSFDTSFGGGVGWVRTGVAVEDQANGMARQADGKILLCGNFVAGAFPNVYAMVFRFMPNGTPDLGFGVNGVSELANYGFTSNGAACRAIALDPFGRIVGTSFGQGLGVSRWFGN